MIISIYMLHQEQQNKRKRKIFTFFYWLPRKPHLPTKKLGSGTLHGAIFTYHRLISADIRTTTNNR